jgi:hypothetical protein
MLDPASTPVSFFDLPSSCPYTGTGASVSADGSHVLYAAAVDSNGNAGAVVSAGFQIDTTPPALSPSISPSPVLLNGPATASPNASDPTPGSGHASASCPVPPTSAAGVQAITCTAADNAGNTATAQLSYVVQYALSSFLSPQPQTKWKAGATVPVKIQLTGANGTLIPDTEASSLAASCRVAFSATGAQPLTKTCLKYNATTHQFSYNWKLAKGPTGTDTITVTVGYPGTAITTTKTETITITS